MTTKYFNNLPYYEKIIKSHHHELEGIFLGFVDLHTKNIEYSEFIPITNIKMIMPPIDYFNETKTIYKILDKNTAQVILNKQESRYFDVICQLNKNIDIQIDNNYTFEITNLTEKTINNIIKYNYITVPNPLGNTIKTLIPNTQNKEILAYGGNPLLSIEDIFNCVITYKFIDPVIRMCCEYVIIIDEYFSQDRNRIQEYIINNKYVGNKILNYTKAKLLVKSINKDHGPTINGLKQNASVCSIGNGIGDECCTHILRNKYLSKLSIQHSLFDLRRYNECCQGTSYLDSPFRVLYRLGLESPQIYLLDQSDEYNFFLVQILQTAIDEIISIAGRVFGYPSIHLFEVIDSNNTTWILRSELFHLMNSPCVHNGIHSNTMNCLRYLHLKQSSERLQLPAVNWLHTIAHTLDLLYCGRNEVYDSRPINNKMAFKNIVKYFGIFMVLMSKTNGNNLICGVIPNDPENISIYFNDYVELFYYICVNDFNAIKNKLNRIKDIVLPERSFGSKQIDQQHLDGVTDDLLLELKDTSKSIVRYNKGEDRMPLINDLIDKIKTHFDDNSIIFPIFDQFYSLSPQTAESINFTYSSECSDLKNAYTCKSSVNQYDWYLFNPDNVQPDDGKSALDIMSEKYSEPITGQLDNVDLSGLSGSIFGSTGYSCATGQCLPTSNISWRDDTWDA